MMLEIDLHVVFRTDASFDIGSGHVMRCLTLADTLRERSANCSFVCRALPGHLLGLIRERGYDAHALPLLESGVSSADTLSEPLPAHAAWLGSDYITDAQQMLATLGDKQFDWLVVDHYALDAGWERSVRGVCRRLMVIDDLADRRHTCDILLDQNLGRKLHDYADLIPDECEVLVGPRYALLRPDFRELREYSLKRRLPSELKTLLVTMGGVDKSNATGAVLEALKACSLPADLRIDVVMGAMSPWLKDVKKKALQMPWPTHVEVNVKDMAKMMAESDFCVGAAGSTSWERCCLGLPSLTVVLAENQAGIAKALDDAGAAIASVDVAAGDFSVRLRKTLSDLMIGSISLSKMTESAVRVVDGLGVDRVRKSISGCS